MHNERAIEDVVVHRNARHPLERFAKLAIYLLARRAVQQFKIDDSACRDPPRQQQRLDDRAHLGTGRPTSQCTLVSQIRGHGHVSKYDEKENADAAEEVVLLTSLGLNHRSTVVDLGAGTGQFAIAVAASCSLPTGSCASGMSLMQQCGFEIVDATQPDDGFFARYVLKKG